MTGETTPPQPPAAEPKHEWVDDGFEHRVVYSEMHSGLIHQMRRPATHREWPWQAAGDMYQADEIARLAAHSQAQAARIAELERALADLAERAERARSILQREGGNWGMLDTAAARAALETGELIGGRRGEGTT